MYIRILAHVQPFSSYISSIWFNEALNVAKMAQSMALTTINLTALTGLLGEFRKKDKFPVA